MVDQLFGCGVIPLGSFKPCLAMTQTYLRVTNAWGWIGLPPSSSHVKSYKFKHHLDFQHLLPGHGCGGCIQVPTEKNASTKPQRIYKHSHAIGNAHVMAGFQNWKSGHPNLSSHLFRYLIKACFHSAIQTVCTLNQWTLAEPKPTKVNPTPACSITTGHPKECSLEHPILLPHPILLSAVGEGQHRSWLTKYERFWS